MDFGITVKPDASSTGTLACALTTSEASAQCSTLTDQ